MSIAPLPRLSYVNWLNSHNKHCSMMIRNYSTLLIGDTIIVGLSPYSNIWKRYFQPLNAINSGIGRDRVQNILSLCHNLPYLLISRMLSLCVVQTTSNTIL